MSSLTALRELYYFKVCTTHTTQWCTSCCPCPIVMLYCQMPLLKEKHDEMFEQGIIILITEPTKWFGSFSYSLEGEWQNVWLSGSLWQHADICCDNCCTPIMEEITHEIAKSARFIKCDGTLFILCCARPCEVIQSPIWVTSFLFLPSDSLVHKKYFSEW